MSISTDSAVHFDPYDVEVDLATARLSPTSTVRGWDTMPAVFA